MKKQDRSDIKDQEVCAFFDQLKLEEARQPLPELEELMPPIGKRSGKRSYMRYAATIVLLATGLGAYQLLFKASPPAKDTMEIVISFEDLTYETEDDLQLEGMDQWESETDIFLTGL